METKQTQNSGGAVESAMRGVVAPNVKPIEALLERLGPKAVFGEPVTAGDVTVIPVAEIRTGFGFGGGQGRKVEATAPGESEEGGGSGGGGGGKVIPRGYIYITPEGVRFRPIVDITRVALAGLAGMAFMVFVIARMLDR